MAHHWYSARSSHRLSCDDSVPQLYVSSGALSQSVSRPILHLYLSSIPPCLAVPSPVRLFSDSILSCLHLHEVCLLACIYIAGAWPRMTSSLVGTRLAAFSAPLYPSPIWSGRRLTISISIHFQSDTNTTAMVQVFISLARCLVMERLEHWSSLHLGFPSSGVHHILLPHPVPSPHCSTHPPPPAQWYVPPL